MDRPTVPAAAADECERSARCLRRTSGLGTGNGQLESPRAQGGRASAVELLLVLVVQTGREQSDNEDPFH